MSAKNSLYCDDFYDYRDEALIKSLYEKTMQFCPACSYGETSPCLWCTGYVKGMMDFSYALRRISSSLYDEVNNTKELKEKATNLKEEREKIWPKKMWNRKK